MRRDVDAELSFHLEGRIEELVARGMSRADAELEAARRFGNRERVEAEVEQIDLSAHKRRDMRERFDAIARDARYAVRGLTRRPLYATAVIVTLALAIGANTTIFSMVEAVMLRPYDMPAIGRLAVVHDDFPKMNLRHAGLSPLEVIDLVARKELFVTAAGITGDSRTTDVHGENANVSGAMTMGEFFTLFGAQPLYGHVYRPEDSEVGRPQLVVLSYRFWQQLSGDSTIVGKTILLSDKPFVVTGIMPPSFHYPRSALYWRPLVITDDMRKVERRGDLSQVFVGRLADGMTLERLRPALRALADEWHKTYPGGYGEGGHTLTAQSFVEFVAGQLRPITITLFAAVAFVLLIACANIASLQLVRAAGRAREIAVRAALGAGRAAIVRQLIVESGVLAIAGGAAGVVLGWAGLSALAKLDLSQFPALKGLHLDSTVLAFTAGTVVLAGLAFGVAPAFRAARVDVNDSLRDAGRGSTASAGRHRFLRASVIVQNTLTLLLLTGAALTMRSLGKLMQVDPGFQPANVVTFNVSMPASRYPTRESQYDFIAALDEQLAAIPGVQAVGFAAGVPFTSSGGSTHYKLPNIPEGDGEPQRHANQAWVYGDYFKALGIQIVRGRAFTPADYNSALHAVIVDENLVRQSFGNRDPIGEPIEHGVDGTIVGVARAVKSNDLTEEAHPLVYHVTGQIKIAGNTAIIRSTLSPGEVIKAARAVALRADPHLIIGSPTTLTKSINDSLGARRLATWVIAGFAGLSLILALLGVYAVMSYVVSQRTKEIGIRVALGAQRAEVAGMVMRDGAILAITGLAIGGIALVALARLLQSLLFGIGVFDPIAIGASVALLGGVTIAACYLPARRAVRVDPVVTLRSE